MERLLREVDVDGDKKITVDDFQKPHKKRASLTFWLQTRGWRHASRFPEFLGLSNLLQELKLASDENS